MGRAHSAPRMHMQRAPRMGGHHGPRIGRHAPPRGHAMRSFSRPDAAARGRHVERRALRGHASEVRRGPSARTLDRAEHRAMRREMRDPAMSRGPAARAARESLRSSDVRGRADRGANTFARNAFSGRAARAQVAGLFRERDVARRGDRSGFARGRFPGAYWPGPFFFPYAYYDETFWLWPTAYDRAFWSYGYGDVLGGIYGPRTYSSYEEFIDGVGRPSRRARVTPPQSFADLCGEAAPGLTEWPVDTIAAAVEPDEKQRALLDTLVRDSDKAAEQLRAACPRNIAATPVGRLEGLERQLAALEEAIRTVRPALENFYSALSDDQKERFNALGPNARPQSRRTRGATGPEPDRLMRACQENASAAWPADRIAEAVRPDERQAAALNELRVATDEAAKIVQAACPGDPPLTPPGRLAAMEQRVHGLLQASQRLKPALDKFYGSLNDEQKARFNRALGGDRRTG